ncbi:MAG: hypothetical protein GY715_13815, partial [Planctomycetes bacterium]|nr:hypothetical protein [Planctomycetota bacterium]
WSTAAAIYLVVGAVACGALGWLPLHLLRELAVDPPYPKSEIPGLAAAAVEHRAIVPLLALPALLCGIALLRTSWSPRSILTVGTIALLLPLAVTLYCFVSLVAPLYQMHEI